MHVIPTEHAQPHRKPQSSDQDPHEYGSLSHVNMNTTQLASEQRLINRADIFL